MAKNEVDLDRKPGGPAGKGLKVVPKREGWRRAGRAFTGEGETIAFEDLTVSQVEQLKGDSMLVVSEVDLPKAEPEKKAETKK